MRERLTELGVDYVACQAPADADARAALRDAKDSSVIPAVCLEEDPPPPR